MSLKSFEFQRVKQQQSKATVGAKQFRYLTSTTWLLSVLLLPRQVIFSVGLWVSGFKATGPSLLPLRLVARTTEHSAVPLRRPSSSELFLKNHFPELLFFTKNIFRNFRIFQIFFGIFRIFGIFL